LDIPAGDFRLNWGYQDKKFGAYDFYTPGSGYPSKERTRTYLLNTGFNLDKAGLLIKPNFLWRRHYDKFMLDKTQVRSSYLNYHRTDIYTPNIYFQKEAGALGRMGLGLEYGQERISSTILGSHVRGHESIFADIAKDLGPGCSFGLSGRFDEFDGFGANFTGSASLKYKVTEKDALRLAVSRSIRVPSFTELYYSDPTTQGEPGLSAQKSLNYEAGYERKDNFLSLGATFFFRQEKDFIDWVKHSPGQAKWQAENTSGAGVFGLEDYLKLCLTKNITLDSNYTYVNRDVSGKGYIYKYGPNYARHLMNAMLKFSLPFGAQGIGFTYKKKPGRGGWFLLNASLSYKLNKNSRIFLDAENILDKEYEEIGGIPQPGRYIEGGLRFEW
jgi:iron complex outermembrane receptor protein